MTSPFGSGPLTVLRRPGTIAGGTDLDGVRAAASRPAPGSGPVLLLSRCTPTAAFSRRDTLRAGHERALAAVRADGWEPVVRPVGGHLAGYDEGSLVLHLWAPHPEPRRDLQARFRLVGEALAQAATALGVPGAGVGPVPGEYCDGAFSLNVAGRAKVAGTGQRLFRDGYLFCAVLTVARPEPLRAMLTRAYARLDLPLDPATVGSLDDHVPGLTVEDAREVVAAGLTRTLAEAAGADEAGPLTA